MSDNDLIRRRDALSIHIDNMFIKCGEIYIGLHETIEAIENIPASPQEMSAREFVATISDMCINQFPEGCAPCPLWVAGHGCGEKILPPDEAVAIVEKWVREHPEERSEE